jgi:predicted permease
MKGILIIAPLIMVIAVGMALRLTGFADSRDREKMGALLYWVILPSLLFRTTCLSRADAGQKNLFIATYASLIIVPAAALTLSSAVRSGKKYHALSAMMSIRSNSVYLGMPVAAFALGEDGLKAVSIYLTILLPVYDVSSIIWGEAVLSGSSKIDMRPALLKIAKNPLVASSLLGLFAAQMGIYIPKTVLDAFKLMGDAASGIALIMLGCGLKFSGVLGAFRRTWPDIAVKLMIHPAIVWMLFKIWPVPGLFVKTAVIVSAMPTAVYSFIVADKIGLDEEYATETITVTTIAAIITIPAWIHILAI